MQTLKLEGDASQKFQTTLGGQVVDIELRWNVSVESWFFSMFLTDGTTVIKSRRLSTNNNALSGILIDNFIGAIVPVSLVTPVQELSRNAWTTTHALTYFDEGEDF